MRIFGQENLYGNNYISYKENIKILGFTFDSKHSFNKQISQRINLVKFVNTELFRFKTINPKLLLNLFKIYILKIVTFSVISLIHNSTKGLK